MKIAIAQAEDLLEIRKIYSEARNFMRSSGNPDQWGENYPPEELTVRDIEEKLLYKAVLDDEILGVFYFVPGEDPTYVKIYDGAWKNDAPYAVIHRVATSASARGKGVCKAIFDYCFAQYPNLKIDTHKDNIPMQRALEKSGFEYCGIIYVADGSERIAYQKI